MMSPETETEAVSLIETAAEMNLGEFLFEKGSRIRGDVRFVRAA